MSDGLLGGFTVTMIRFLDVISFLLVWGYTAVFFLILKTFLPLRGNVIAKVPAFVVCGFLADSIIYPNDPGGLFGTMLLFILYILLFYRGTWMEKLSVLLVFYPALIAINHLMLDTGGRFFRLITQAEYEDALHSPSLMLISTGIHTATLLLRLLFWIGAWLILRNFLSKIRSRLDTKTWLIIDMLMLASFVAIFTILCFMPEKTAIMYPICGASIFSSFGCMYLAAYLYDSMQTTYRMKQMEAQRDYYRERAAQEERVRSIYHDLKNHLLVLENRQNTEETRRMSETLRAQIENYEDYVHTGNEFLDLILKDKAAKAREKQIDFSALVDFKGMDFIEPLDISTIFGNAIDNAIEASESLPQEERLITLRSERIRDMLMISIENNTAPGAQPAGVTTKKDRFAHGFGIPNIKKAVEKYDGQCRFRQKEGTYRLNILIPL
ncbi:MAG: ATP-binding protein [Eubacteriales bacterium]|nr:ATP-binding protein [Eubacteriales bacterium]